MKSRHAVLILLVTLSMVTYLDRVCISALGPRMQAELNLTQVQWGWILGAFTLAYGLFEIPTGALGDRYGQRRILTRIVLWWSVFTVLTGCVSGFALLVAVRFLFGMGEAGAYPNMSGSASRWFETSERGWVQGLIWGASRAGAIFAPLLVGLIVAWLGNWRAVFWIFGGLGLLWVTCWRIWYRDPTEELPDSISGSSLTAAPAGEASHPPLPWRSLIRSRQLWVIMSMYFCYVWGSIFYLSWLHTYLVRGRGLSEADMTYLSSLPFVLGAVANPLGGLFSDWLTRRLGARNGRRLIGATCLLGASACLLATALTTGKWSGIVLLSLGFGLMDFMLPSAWAACMDVGGRYAGAVSGAMNSFGNLGGAVCAVLFGYLVRETGSYGVPLLVIAAMVALAGVLFTQIDASRTLLAEQAPPAPAAAFPAKTDDAALLAAQS